MALITTLRKRMGKIVVGLVAFSMVAFIGTDLLQGNSMIFGNRNEVGEINGNTITYEQFNQKVNELAYNFSLNMGRNPLSQEMEQLRLQAWQQLIVENAFYPEFEEVGLAVPAAEEVDMVQGNNIHPQIRQYFTDPNTGQFSRQSVISFLQQLNTADAQQRASWVAFEEGLAKSRLLQKYENLLEKTNYVTTYEAKTEYMGSATASTDYLYVPFFSVSDTLFSVTESELQSYINDNEEAYKTEASKDISYIEFEIAPSSEDTAYVIQEVNTVVEGLKNAQNDSIYASINSEGNQPFTSYKRSELPAALVVDGEVIPEGEVTEPIIIGNFYTFYKLSEISEGDEAFLKASHILFRAEDETDQAKADARAEANRVLREIKNGADFGAMAAQYGTDGTASRGGDLGWFGENSSFVQEFKDAAFAFRGTGLLPNVVETEFGYHLIKITEPKTYTVYKVATIEKEIFPSDETLNEIYREADLFATEVTSIDDFNAKADERGYQVKQANNLKKNDKRVGSQVNARSIVFWLFNKADNGSVSEVFDMEDSYLVAIQTGEQEEGIASVDDVRNEVTRKVIDQKKADYIIEKLSGLSGSYEEIATSYGEGARTGTADLELGSNSFGTIGFAPKAVGTAFSLEIGESTLPFKSQNGVIMLTVTDKNTPDEVDSYEAYRPIVQNERNTFRRREEPLTMQSIYNAIVDNVSITDERYKFY